DWLVRESGWTVTERDDPSQRVPIAPRHICLLLKRFQRWNEDVTHGYVRALETRRVPHVLVGGRSFHQREEIVGIRNALTAIEWPSDELSVYATLRGPFFALHDAALLTYRGLHPRRSLHPLAPIDDAVMHDPELAPVAGALALLRSLHYARNRRPIADSIARLLDETRAHAGIAIWPHGEQALANVLRMLDLARRFEADGATSFRAFVERLDDDAASGEAGDAPVVEEGTEGVRIMTVHRAKGLEFAVVILCEPSAPPTWQNPSRYVDSESGLWAQALMGCMPHELLTHRDEALARDEEEAVRLAYVAATRARDLLVVPASGDEPVEGWLAALHPAIYPPLDKCRRPGRAPGAPPFGTDSVLERPMNAKFEPSANVAPGQHEPQRGTHRVVWWDPATLALDKEHDVGLRQQRILVADEERIAARAGSAAHEAWVAARSAALTNGAVVKQPADAVTRWSQAQPPEGAPAVELLVTTVSRDGRPRGKRFGTLVHAALATVPLDASAELVRSACDLHARLSGATGEELDAAVTAVVGALAHPLLARARAATRACREHAVVHALPDGSLLEG
ncbi:MAG TPA: 3'-5' exonuclease, partial [Gemmatimonadales bacterium]|nr:3'-5' exonuclease [Gemmatimonadales bacterium]